jgi:hypothetical protein
MLLKYEQFNLEVRMSCRIILSTFTPESQLLVQRLAVHFSVRTSNLWNADKGLGQSLVMSNSKLKIKLNL